MRSVKKLFGKSSSKELAAKPRPGSSGNTSSNSSRSRDGSAIDQMEPPVPGSQYGGQSTPDSSLQSSTSVSDLPKLIHPASDNQVPQVQKLQQRPLSMMSSSKRRSVTGYSTSGMLNSPVSRGPIPMYAPRVTNIKPGSRVFQKVILIRGVCGDENQAGNLLDGILRITYGHKQVSCQECAVVGGVFKSTVYLVPGRNTITLEFFSAKLKDNRGSVSNQKTVFPVIYVPDPTVPPLRLAVLVANDSPHTIDSTRERIAAEGNDLTTVCTKFRMAAQICQIACAELMARANMGHRSFRLEEEWTQGSTLRDDRFSGRMHNEPKIQFLPVNITVAELKSLVQSGKEELVMRLITDALESTIPHSAMEPQNALVLLLDAHWNPKILTAEGHMKAVGGNENFNVTVMGSQFLYSIPSSIEDIEPTFQDCTRLESKVQVPGMGIAGSIWEVADLTLTAMLRNVLQVFGSQATPLGINGAYADSNTSQQRIARLFMSRQPFGISSRSAGPKCVLEEHEPFLHELDGLRLRFSPSFAIPDDEYLPPAARAFVWPVQEKSLVITSTAGITYIELFARNDQVPCGVLNLVRIHAQHHPNTQELQSVLHRQYSLSEPSLRKAMPPGKFTDDIRLVVHSYGAVPTVVPDVSALYKKANNTVKHSKIRAFRSLEVGRAAHPDSVPQEVIWQNAADLHSAMKSIVVFHSEQQVYGIEIWNHDHDSQLFGTKGPAVATNEDVPVRSEFGLDLRQAELPFGFVIWTDDSSPIRGLQIISNNGRTSDHFGDTSGANPYRAVAPLGYTLAGLAGSVGDGIDSLRLIVKQ